MSRNAVLIGAASALVCVAAHASTLGPPIIEGSIASWNTGADASLSGPGTITGGSEVASGTPTGNVSVTGYFVNGGGFISAAQTSYATGFNETENAGVRILSEFEVVGPTNSAVPLLFTATGQLTTSAAITSTASAYAWVGSSIDTSDIFATSASACTSFSCPAGVASTGSFNANYSFLVSSNTVYYVTIGANANTNVGAFNVSVDPSVTFGSGFAGSGYSLIYSSDAPLATPLPAAAWLLLSGLGGLGALARKRSPARAGTPCPRRTAHTDGTTLRGGPSLSFAPPEFSDLSLIAATRH